MNLAAIIGLIIAFIVVVGGTGIAIWLILLRNIASKEERLANIEARNKVRLSWIEEGMDPDLADRLPERATSNRLFLFGLILGFACLGRIIAYFSIFNFNSGDKTFLYALPAFFAGFGILVYHFYQKKIAFRKNK
jgi:hypothetical protein